MLDGEIYLAELICKNMQKYIDSGDPKLLKRITPEMVYFILDYMKNNGDEKYKSNETIFKFISNYLDLNPDINLTLKERNSFHKLIDWESPDIGTIFPLYNTDWVNFNTSRVFLNEMFNKRRRTIEAMKMETENGDQTNIWNAISWISNITKTNGNNKLDEVELVNFIGTIGGVLTKPLNPVKHKLIEASCQYMKLPILNNNKKSNRKIYDMFHTQNAFYPFNYKIDRYLLSIERSREQFNCKITIQHIF